MTATDPVTFDDQGKAADAFPFHVLLSPPISRTVPIFGLAANANRPDHELWSVSERDDCRTVDRQALGKLKGGKFGGHRYLVTRRKIGPREVRYARWLAFRDEEGATAFLAEFPRYGLSNLLAASQRRIARIEHELRQGLLKGRYNLGELDQNVRYEKAKLYVTAIDELRGLRCRVAALESLGLTAGLTSAPESKPA